MTLEEAKNIIIPILDKPLKELFPDENIYNNIIKDKGKTGKLLETIVLHLNLSNTLRDFSDGELKTCQFRRKDFVPDETIAITMTTSTIDDYLSIKPFIETNVFKKISNFLLVPIVKVENSVIKLDPHDWYYSHPIHVNYNNPNFNNFYKQIEQDYYYICNTLKTNIEAGGFLSTTTGKYMQIRTKGSGAKTIVFSKLYNRNVNENGAGYAFYFTREGIKALINII